MYSRVCLCVYGDSFFFFFNHVCGDSSYANSLTSIAMGITDGNFSMPLFYSVGFSVL